MAALSITYDLLLLSLYYLLPITYYFPKLTSLYLLICFHFRTNQQQLPHSDCV